MRLGRFLAHAGAASRRASETLVRDGRVTVNGTIVLDPARDVAESDRILLDGRPVRLLEKAVTILLYKPLGVLSTVSDPQGRPTVVDLVGQGRGDRLYPVGRLDRDSEGLLLLSNDGDLVNRLTHPRYGHRKEYLVVAFGPFDEATLEFLNSAMTIDGYRIRPAQVDYLERLPDGRNAPRHRLRFILGEGRNRQIRNMCELAGLRVQTLVRTAINGLRLPRDLRPGQWRDLGPDDLARLEQDG